VHQRERDRFKELDSFTGENRNSLRGRQIARRPEKLLNAIEIAEHGLGQETSELETRQSADCCLYPILQLDLVFAAGSVPGLQLQVAGDHAVIAGLNAGQTLKNVGDR
jgi:hypothetical protein